MNRAREYSHCANVFYLPTLQFDNLRKITVFRWVNTAIIPVLIIPLTNVLSAGSRDLIPTIASVLIFDLYLTPLLQLADPYGFLKKHFLAPRFSKTQAQMNSYFLGTPFNIAERYTDLTKMMFLCFYYSVLYPAGEFFYEL